MARSPRKLDRRTLLRGAGVACALPYLEAMTWAKPLQGGTKDEETHGAPRRAAYVYFPNGCSLPGEKDTENAKWRWFPSGEGRDFQFTEVLRSLEPFRDRLSILGGLSHPLSRNLLGHLAGDTWLTAGDMRGDLYKNRVSADQVAAKHLEPHTRYPSIVLSTDGGVGYKSRVSTLSFDRNGRPIPSEHRHRQVFERYFSPDGGASTEERRRNLRAGKKVVDLVLEESKRLRSRLGQHDQSKMDEYLSSLNAVEEQVRRNEAWLDVPLPEFNADHIDLDPNPKADPTAYLRTTFDLIVLGFQLDLTRVVSYMMGREDGMGYGDNFPKLALGINKGHHTISHDLAQGHWEEWGRFDRWYAEQFTYFIEKLSTTTDAHGPLLDDTMVLYGSCCSTTHNANNYPLALVGGSNMGLQHGTYRRYGNEVPFSNLLLTMLHALGVKDETFADSTGTIPGLLA